MIQNEEYNGYFLFDDISRYKYYILSWHSLSVFNKKSNTTVYNSLMWLILPLVSHKSKCRTTLKNYIEEFFNYSCKTAFFIERIK